MDRARIVPSPTARCSSWPTGAGSSSEGSIGGPDEPGITRMLRIGEFARLTGLSVRTLRFYDAVSILRPAEVDALTGYRLYALHQLQIASRIVALRRLGLQLDEVREALTGELAERE